MNQAQRIIEITISPTGDTTVETKGFQGSSCRDATKRLEQALGKTTGEQLTSEFYLAQPAQQQRQTQN